MSTQTESTLDFKIEKCKEIFKSVEDILILEKGIADRSNREKLENYQEKVMNTQVEIQAEDISDFKRSAYKDVCEELREVLTLEKEVAKRKAELRAAVLTLSGGDRMEYGIKVHQRTAKGTIDYKKIVSELEVSDEECEKYRKDTRSYWDVRSY